MVRIRHAWLATLLCLTACAHSRTYDVLGEEAWWFPSVPCQASRSDTNTELQFAFVSRSVRTDQHFPGQINDVYVRYGYAGLLKSANEDGIDVVGYDVAADTYPYFQLVQQDIEDLLTSFPDKSVFYEALLQHVAESVMAKYPQMRWLQLSLVALPHPQFRFERAATITMLRNP